MIEVVAKSSFGSADLTPRQVAFNKNQRALLSLLQGTDSSVTSAIAQLTQFLEQGFFLAQSYSLLDTNSQQTLQHQLGSSDLQLILNLSKSNVLLAEPLWQLAKHWNLSGKQGLALQVLSLLKGDGDLLMAPLSIREAAQTLDQTIRGIGNNHSQQVYTGVSHVFTAAQDPEVVISLVLAGRLGRMVQGGVANLGSQKLTMVLAKFGGWVTGINVEAGVFTGFQLSAAYAAGQTINFSKFLEKYPANLVMVGSLKAGGSLFGKAAEMSTRSLEFAKFNIATAQQVGSFGGLYFSSAIANPTESVASRMINVAAVTVQYGLAGELGSVAVGAGVIPGYDNVILSNSHVMQSGSEAPSFRNFLMLGSSNANPLGKVLRSSLWMTLKLPETSIFLGPHFATAIAGEGNYRAERASVQDDVNGLHLVFSKRHQRGRDATSGTGPKSGAPLRAEAGSKDTFTGFRQAPEGMFVDNVPVQPGSKIFYQDGRPRYFYAAEGASIHGVPVNKGWPSVFLHENGTVRSFDADQGGMLNGQAVPKWATVYCNGDGTPREFYPQVALVLGRRRGMPWSFNR